MRLLYVFPNGEEPGWHICASAAERTQEWGEIGARWSVLRFSGSESLGGGEGKKNGVLIGLGAPLCVAHICCEQGHFIPPSQTKTG